MNKNSFILELIVSIIYLFTIFMSESIDIYLGILFLLVYLCSKVSFYIFKKEKIRTFILGAALFFILCVSIITPVPMSFFLVLTLSQLMKSYFVVSAFGLLYFLNVGQEYQVVYLVLSILVLYILRVLYLHEEVYKRQKNVINTLEVKISELNEKNQFNEIYDSTMTYATRLEERELIAQQLHDELGHVLSGNTMQLEAALLLLEPDVEKSKSMIRKVIESLRSGTESIRQILKTIQPNSAAINIENIKKLIVETEESSGVTIQLNYDQFISDLTYKQWQMIYINTKEALTNMMKYAKASQCAITFERLNYQYKISIKDNGIGGSGIKKGMGLRGIEQRTIDMNGQVIVDGSQGFSLIMLLPIERKNNDKNNHS